MSSVLLVICSEDANTEKFTLLNRVVKYVGRLFYRNIRVKSMQKKLNLVEVYDGLKVYLLELPCTSEEFCKIKSKTISNLAEIKNKWISKLLKSYESAVASKKCNMIFAAIDEICSKMGIEMFYLSNQLLNNSYFKSYCGELSTGKLLFQALIVEILIKLYSNKADISQLDIVVIEDGNRHEVINVVRMLYPITKFITVLTQDKTWLENELEDIYIKAGLSISVMSDFEKGLKSADIIICYGDISKITTYKKLKPKAMVIHYHSNREEYLSITELDVNNIMINGLDIYIPPSIIMKLGRLKPKHFNSLELAEILIKSRISLPVNTKQRDAALQDLAKAFNEGGYYIKQFKGFKLKK